MKILKASAGSGKTYRLANSYIDLLLKSPDRYAYRHILAVTFTNKATAEMKSRILKFLHKKAATDPKARLILSDILHDYSAFSISTIDKFFQQALKAFAREIGLLNSYQIDLDRKALIEESMDRILDSLSEDRPEMIGWIAQSMEDSLEKGEKFGFENSLYVTGSQLGSEQYRELAAKYGISAEESFGKRKLGNIRSVCRGIIDGFEKKALQEGAVKEKNGKIKIPAKKTLEANPVLADLFDKQYRLYVTAVKLYSTLPSLGLAGEFHKEFEDLLKEKNVMCLDESNTLLGRIIDGSDAPFVYEKLGVRYEHFLLDEFQDTSSIQWQNFLPLLKESESHDGESLIVGDVKQSIYRWRGSDWRLLSEGVKEQFPDASEEILDDNWRSCRTIVEFNNRFFKWLADKTGTQKIYSDVRQGIKTKDTLQEGEVKLSFTDDIPEVVLESIRKACEEQGAKYSDIAILVRNNTEGSTLAGFLIKEGIPVLSDESLKLKSAVSVRRAVSLLSYTDNPKNDIGAFLAKDFGLEFPRSYHSVTDMAEAVLRGLQAHDPELFAGETLFIQSFMDDLKNWVETNGNDLGRYLAHWKESDLSISSPADSSAVRILTIHKSKGLQFPYVIFPYAEKVDLYKHGSKWCRMDPGKSRLDDADGIYPVDLTEDCSTSLFSQAYNEERGLQIVDNLNIFYVAFTRAEKTLHVISKQPGPTLLKYIDKENFEFKRFSDMMFKFCGKNPEYREGRPYDFTKQPKDDDDSIPVTKFDFNYESYPLGSRLVPSTDAEEFFGDDGTTGAAASVRLMGVALHGILESIKTPSDTGSAVREAILDGILSEKEAEKALRLLEKRTQSHPEWFGPSLRILNEQAIFDSGNKECRPDRVIIDGDKLFVLDYKFGEHKDNYRLQVLHYMKLFRKMGWKSVRGAVWYVFDDIVEEV